MVHVPSDMACICYEIVICRNTPLLKAILELSSRVLGPCSSLLFLLEASGGVAGFIVLSSRGLMSLQEKSVGLGEYNPKPYKPPINPN